MARAKPETAPTTKSKTPPTTKPATPKPSKATKAKAAKATTESTEKKGRRPGGDRGWLATAIDKVLRKASGPMTVAEIAAKIKNTRDEHPSSGAVAAALIRWQEQGYVELTGQRPQAFKRFTKKYESKNLDTFLSDQRETRAKQRAAAKAGKAA